MLNDKYARCVNCKQWVSFNTNNYKNIKATCPHCNKWGQFNFSKRPIKEILEIIEYEKRKKLTKVNLVS